MLNLLDTLTPEQFLSAHIDMTEWTTADHESYEVLTEIAHHVPPLYSPAEMQTIAADHARSALAQHAEADRLAGEGHDIAAGIWRRGAQAAQEHAAAAREGWPMYEAVLNGW
ncbi:hypothetical protein [Streptomyces sp. NPDC093109]|uniref:hypothetical protein n=1 Tax=Streptomyces sp. NPDC093109 TaxID=3154977 RepID=UPI00344D9C19